MGLVGWESKEGRRREVLLYSMVNTSVRLELRRMLWRVAGLSIVVGVVLGSFLGWVF